MFRVDKRTVKPIKEQQGSLKDDLRDLLHNKPWWILLGAGVSALVFNSIRDGATVYYFKYFIIEEAYANVSLFGVSFVLSGLYLAVGQAANIVGVILAAPLSNRIGKKRTYMGSMLIASVLSILFFWLDKTDIALIFTFQVFISICAGSIFPLLWSMYADCTDYSEHKNREPCHRIDLQFLVHEPEIRMGDRHGYHRLATRFLRVSGQYRTKRGND